MHSDIPSLNLKTSKKFVDDNSSSRSTFRRKGTTYVIKSDSPNQNDSDDIFHVIDDLYEDVIGQSKMADFQATAYKFLSVIASIFIVIAGAVTGILAINTNTMNTINAVSNTTNAQQDYGTLLAITVLGFTVTVTKTLLVLFTIEKRSILLKESGIKLRKLAREIKGFKNMNLTNTELFQRIDAIHTELDELDITMFKNDVSKPNIQPTQSQANLSTAKADLDTDTVINL